MLNLDTNYKIIKNQAIYVIVSIAEINTSKPLFYNYGKIDTIIRSSANALKNINSQVDDHVPFNIKIISIHDDENDMMKMMNILMSTVPPIFGEISTVEQKPRGRPATAAIRCIETGETWPSAAICARSLNISQPRLSAHLSHRLGRIAGRTYERI